MTIDFTSVNNCRENIIANNQKIISAKAEIDKLIGSPIFKEIDRFHQESSRFYQKTLSERATIIKNNKIINSSRVGDFCNGSGKIIGGVLAMTALTVAVAAVNILISPVWASTIFGGHVPGINNNWFPLIPSNEFRKLGKLINEGGNLIQHSFENKRKYSNENFRLSKDFTINRALLARNTDVGSKWAKVTNEFNQKQQEFDQLIDTIVKCHKEIKESENLISAFEKEHNITINDKPSIEPIKRCTYFREMSDLINRTNKNFQNILNFKMHEPTSDFEIIQPSLLFAPN